MEEKEKKENLLVEESELDEEEDEVEEKESFESEQVDYEDVSLEDEETFEKAKADYTASDIKVLEGLEPVRQRPGMYIGTTSARGLHHLVREIVDNSVDEALAGYCKNIKITLEKDGSVTVEDDGRGIPCGIVEQTGMSAVETVYTVLHAGGKFEGSDGYKVSGGLHGVGASVVNALSTQVTVTVRNEGKIHQIKFENGGHTVEPGTSTGFYPSFNLPMTRSPWLRVYDMQLNSPCSDSLSLRLRDFHPLTSLHTVTRRFILQKTRHYPCGL